MNTGHYAETYRKLQELMQESIDHFSTTLTGDDLAHRIHQNTLGRAYLAAFEAFGEYEKQQGEISKETKKDLFDATMTLCLTAMNDACFQRGIPACHIAIGDMWGTYDRNRMV